MLRFLSFCLLLFPCAPALAQQWPQRPVHLIVAYPAGGGADTVARVLAQKLGEIFQQSFVVENKSGASGMIGAASVAKSDPGGYLLLVSSPSEDALSQNLSKSLN